MTLQIQQYIWAVEKVRDAFQEAVYGTRDVDAALALAAGDCVVRHLPSGSGGTGHDELRRHLTEDVLPHLPDDLVFTRVSRTVDKWRVVDETTVAFTHDRELPWLLPGVAPTGRRAEVAAVSVLGVRSSKVAFQRVLWDHVGLVAQLGVPIA